MPNLEYVFVRLSESDLNEIDRALLIMQRFNTLADKPVESNQALVTKIKKALRQINESN